MDKFNEYDSKKTQLLHREQPPATQEELDEVEEMVTNLEKKEAEKCRDIIAKLSNIILHCPFSIIMIRLEYAELQLDETIMLISNYVNSWTT